MTRVIVDTSIAGATAGADPSEGLALLMGLLLPELSVEGVVLTGGDLSMKAAQVRRIFEVTGCSAPLALGSRYDLQGKRSRDASFRPPTVRFVSDCRSTQGLPKAAELLAESVDRWPGEVSLLVLGPPTTAAVSLLAHPELLSGLRQVVLAGCPIGLPVRSAPGLGDAHATAALLRMAGKKIVLHDPGAEDTPSILAPELELEKGDVPEPLAGFVSEYCQSWLAYHDSDALSIGRALVMLGLAGTGLCSESRRRYVLDACNGLFPELLLPADERAVGPPGAIIQSLKVLTDYDRDACGTEARALLRLPLAG